MNEPLVVPVIEHINESKLKRGLAWLKNRSKDHRRRRNRGRRSTNIADGISLSEFERRYPHLPLKVWHAQQYYTGQGGRDWYNSCDYFIDEDLDWFDDTDEDVFVCAMPGNLPPIFA